MVDSTVNSPRSVNQQTLNSLGSPSLNDRLNTSYIDISPDDTTIFASATRTIANSVGRCVTPKQMVGVLRVLKAITISFLILTVAADLMYMSLLEIFANASVRKKAGGTRDTIIRVYGLFLSAIAISIELELSKVVKHFTGLRGYIPRAMLLFFIAVITRSHPEHEDSSSQSAVDDDRYGYNGNYANAYDDGLYATDDRTFAGDNAEIPISAVVFQLVTSSILGLCAVVYFVFGLLCFDRFTSKAFLSTKDPLVTTAIPQPRGQSEDGYPSNQDFTTPYTAAYGETS